MYLDGYNQQDALKLSAQSPEWMFDANKKEKNRLSVPIGEKTKTILTHTYGMIMHDISPAKMVTCSIQCTWGVEHVVPSPNNRING